jgi:hypothetical protein
MEAVHISELIIAHSEMVLFLYQSYFPFHTGKMYSQVIWFSEWIYQEAAQHSSFRKPFEQREIDCLFPAASWERVEKNYPMVEALTKAAPDLNIHILGEVPYFLKGAVHHPLTYSREDVFRLMGNSKMVVCPSRFDAAPAVLFEGSAMDCNLVTSRNCGNWSICNPELLADECLREDFVKCIELGRKRKYEDRVATFLNNGSYCNLVEVLLACCSIKLLN